MFKIKKASEVVARKERVLLGAPDYTKPDLVFTTDFSRDIILSMNSTVLKTALLNSKELLEQHLKIKIVDLNETKPIKKQTKKVSEQLTNEGATKLEWK
jgi:transketolase